jgi:hypothetical protein
MYCSHMCLGEHCVGVGGNGMGYAPSAVRIVLSCTTVVECKHNLPDLSLYDEALGRGKTPLQLSKLVSVRHEINRLS